MEKDLKKYLITIDDEYAEGEDLGMQMVAFTKRPAILTKGMAFNLHAKSQFFSDSLKYRIVAPAMIPMDIYRNDEEGEYEVSFTAEVIEQIHSKFMKNYSSTKIFNLEHNEEKIVPAYILEAWIVEDSKTDKAFTKYGIEVPNGTLMLTSQITDKDYYAKLVANEQTGYSIEGFLGMKLSEHINNTNKNKQKMAKNALKLGEDGPSAYIELPVGVFTIGDKVYTVIEHVENEGLEDEMRYNVIDSIIPVDEAAQTEMADEETPAVSGDTETKETKLATEEAPAVSGDTETKETEMADEPAPAEEAAPAATVAETYTKEEIDNRFAEMARVIADLKIDMDNQAKEDKVEDEVKLSAHDRFSAYVDFSRKLNN